MSHTITIRLNKELAEWLEETAAKTGMPQGKIVREQLEKARAAKGAQRGAVAAGEGDGWPAVGDLCLIRRSELFPKHSIMTVDRDDFRVYRRNKREAIPLICPPGA